MTRLYYEKYEILELSFSSKASGTLGATYSIDPDRTNYYYWWDISPYELFSYDTVTIKCFITGSPGIYFTLCTQNGYNPENALEGTGSPVVLSGVDFEERKYLGIYYGCKYKNGTVLAMNRPVSGSIEAVGWK